MHDYFNATYYERAGECANEGEYIYTVMISGLIVLFCHILWLSVA